MNEIQQRAAALQAAATASTRPADVIPLAEEYLAWLKGRVATAQGDGGGNGNGPPLK